jgi:cathepsin D
VKRDNNLVTRKLIGVNLQRASEHLNDGEVSFGVIDTSKFVGKLSVVPNVATSGLWEAPLTDAFVNGQPMGFVGRTSITDTGTSMLFHKLR